MVKLKVKKLNDKAVIPQQATPGSAGMDLVATDKKAVLGMTAYMEYKTGLAIEIPPGYVGLLFPRSSISNTSLTLANSVGVIDSDYRGEISFRFKALGAGKPYEVGDRIGQLVIVPVVSLQVEEATELDETERGEGSYGSTGK